MSAGRVGLIAGTGRLPALLVQGLAPSLGRPLVAAMEGFAPEGLDPDLWFRVERLVPFLAGLRAEGVGRVVLAGAVRRPRLDPALVDAGTAAVLPRVMAAMQSGDDAALRGIVALIEEQGIAVVGVAELAPELVPGPGVICGAPSPADARDAARAAEIVAALGPMDVGQGAVVAQGLCLAVEALPGTDAMLDFVAATGRGLRPDPDGAKGMLYKAPKPGQDLRFDLPALGPDTVARAAAAGLGGIAWAAGGALLIDREAMVAAAEAAGMFLWSRPG